MKTFRFATALLAAALLTPFAFAQESAEIASLLAKARRGNGIAQYNLGLAYAEGRGTAADPLEAFVWLSLARDNGARGRALDNVLAGFDRPTLAAAEARLAERRASLGVRAAPAPASNPPAAPAVTPAPVAPAPAPVAESQPAAPADLDESLLTRVQAERDALAARTTELNAEIAALRAERERLTKAAADSERASRTAATALAALQNAPKPAPAYPDLSGRVAELEKQLAAQSATAGSVREDATARSKAQEEALQQKDRELQATLVELKTSRAFGEEVEATLNRVTDQKTALETSLRAAEEARTAQTREVETARRRIAELETRSARPAAPAYPNLAGRVAELETALNAAKSAQPAYPDLSGKVAELEQQLAQARQPVAPAYPDLRTRVTELEASLGSAQQSLAAARAAKPAYPDLSGRVADLEKQLATASSDLTAAATLKTEADQARRQLAELTQSSEATQRNFSRELDATKAALAKANDALAARPAAPAYPDLSAKVAELETALTTAKTAQPAYPDLSGQVRELETAQRNLARELDATKAALAAKPSAPAYPDLSGKVADLETQLAAALQPKAPAYPDLSGRVAELEATLQAAQNAAPKVRELEARVAALTAEAALRQRETTTLTEARAEAEKSRDTIAKQFEDYKGSTAAALRERTTLQASVKMLESDKTSLRRQAETAGSEAAQLRTQVASLKEQVAAKPAAPAWPDLSGRVTELEAQLAAAKNASPAYPDLSERVKELETSLATANKSARDGLDLYRTAAAAKTELEAEKARLVGEIKQLASRSDNTVKAQLESRDAELQELRTQLAAVRQPVAPAYPDLSGRVAELEQQLATVKNAAPAYPDLSDRVTGLERQLASSVADLSAATLAKAELTGKVATLETALAAAKTAAPAYPNLSGRVAELETQLAAAKNAAPAYPDLSGRVTELETALAAANKTARESLDSYQSAATTKTELEAEKAQLLARLQPLEAKAEENTNLKWQLSAREGELTAARSQLEETKLKLAAAAKSATPAYPDLSGQVARLNDELTQLRADRERMQKMLADAGRQMRDATASANRAKELEAEVAQLRQTLAAKPEAPAYPDLSGRVAELTAQLAAKPAAPAWPDLSGRVADLEQQLATAKNAPPAYPDLSAKVADLETQLVAAKNAAPAAPAYPDLSGRVAELETAVNDSARQLVAAESAQATLRQQLATANASLQAAAKPQAPAYPDLSGQVAQLNDEVTQLRADRERMQKMLADAGRQMRDATAGANRVKELETQLARSSAEADAARQEAERLTQAAADTETNLKGLQATLLDRTNAETERTRRIAQLESEVERLQSARPAAPAYPDLSGRVADLEARLAEASARPATPAYPDLSRRVEDLQATLADTHRQLSNTQAELARLANQPAPAPVEAAPAADTSGLEQRLAETEGKLSTALRGYALLQKEHDALQAKATQADEALAADKNRLADQVAALSAELDQLKTTAASQAQAAAATTVLAGERDALSARLAEAEQRATLAQAESARLGESLAALQRSTGQTSGEAAAARTLVQQLQGANSVLAQENYQLKTMLARNTGAPAPTAPRTAPAPVPAARMHVVASGDSLSRLSQRYYGTPGRWQEIYNANTDKLGPNGVLRIGTELRIP